MNISVPGLAAVFVFLVIAIAAYAIFVPANPRPLGSSTREDFEFKRNDVVLTGFGRYLQPILRNFLPKLPFTRISPARHKRLADLIIKSGNPLNVNPEEFFGAQLVLALFGALIGFALTFVQQLQVVPAPAWIIGGAALGYLFLTGRYQTAKQERSRSMQKTLPEALDLLTVTMRSGMTFEQAMQKVADQLPMGIVREEFTRAILARGTGASLTDSLTGIYERVDSDEAEAFVKAILQAEALGAEISETLERQSAFARKSYAAMVDRRISALPTAMILPMGITMVPAFLIVIMAPTVYNLTQNLL